MAREGLRPALASAMYQVIANRTPVRHLGLRVKTNGDFTHVNLYLRPATAADCAPLSGLFLVIIEDVPVLPPPADYTSVSPTAAIPSDSERIAALEQQLRGKEEFLQSTLEEMETSNEELKSANEEMQSVNEELATVNAELNTKVADLSRANNDMNNLLAGTGVATLFIDHQLRIVRFTPTATELINLIHSDIGRPVAHIVSNLVNYDHLAQDVQVVLADLIPRAAEVTTTSGTRFLMRIRPYRTLENVIEGAVITFTDISDLLLLLAKEKRNDPDNTPEDRHGSS